MRAFVPVLHIMACAEIAGPRSVARRGPRRRRVILAWGTRGVPRKTVLLFWNPGSFGGGAGVAGTGDGEEEQRLGTREASRAEWWRDPTSLATAPSISGFISGRIRPRKRVNERAAADRRGCSRFQFPSATVHMSVLRAILVWAILALYLYL